MALKPIERDEILIRLDERVKDIKDTDIPEIKESLKLLNGRVRSNTSSIAWIKGIIAGVTVLGGGTAGVLKLFNVY